MAWVRCDFDPAGASGGFKQCFIFVFTGFSGKSASETQGSHRRFGIECNLCRAPSPLQLDRANSRGDGLLGPVFSAKCGFKFPIQQGLFIFTVFARLSACYMGEGRCFPSFIRKNQRHLGTKGEDSDGINALETLR